MTDGCRENCTRRRSYDTANAEHDTKEVEEREIHDNTDDQGVREG